MKTNDNLAMLGLMLRRMAHDKVMNYTLAGLNSQLIGGGAHGKVRMFTCDRDTEFNTPHSHRYDFACLVLEGEVLNRCYRKPGYGEKGNLYCASKLQLIGDGMGRYELRPADKGTEFIVVGTTYQAGQVYAMTWSEIHDIQFARDTTVLFLEGPERVQETTVLEPWSNGKRIPTFKVEDWMFQRAEEYAL